MKECQKPFNDFMEKLLTSPILIFSNWTKEFHVHVDASSITLGTILAQPGEGEIDHPISFSSLKLGSAEKVHHD